VSAVHAEFQATPKGVHLVDLNSLNGVFVGTVRLCEGYLTGPCDIRCGALWLRFVPEPPEQLAVDRVHRFGGLVGTTPQMLELFDALRRFAPTSMPIVIRGETGTGKERVARAIHDASLRRRRPFVAINCAAMPESLLEAELFGHVKGAFTGADRERKGLFAEADGGTLFFDEVGEMSPAMQAKILRALESKEIRPIGSARSRKVDVRTVFATHTDLKLALNDGRFREDLYFRIGKVTVEIPPLRERLVDIALLLQDILEDLGRPDAKIDDADMAMLTARTWPGNMRELRNLVEVALIASTGDTLSLAAGLPAMSDKRSGILGAGGYEAAKKEFERRFYTGLYAACRGNLTQIAKVAGRNRMTVREALREFGLSPGTDSSGDPDSGEQRDP
jgi:DNA-binding NtrC family response regulator